MKKITNFICLGFVVLFTTFFTQKSIAQDNNEESPGEAFTLSWNSTLQSVRRNYGASQKDFATFERFDADTLNILNDDALTEFGKESLDPAIIPGIMKKEKAIISDLYERFLVIKKLYPSSVAEFAAVASPFKNQTCDPNGCTNINFSLGNLSNWYGYYGKNTGTTSFTTSSIIGGALGAVTEACNDVGAGSSEKYNNTNCGKNLTTDYQISITSGGFDKVVPTLPRVSPWATGGHSVMLGDSTLVGQGMAFLSKTFTVTPAIANFNYQYAVLLQNPLHPVSEQPFFSVVVLDQAGDTIPNCGLYNVTSGYGIKGFDSTTYGPACTAGIVYYRPWSAVNVNLTPYLGQCVTIIFEVADCSPGGHFGYAYVNASCAPLEITSNTDTICPHGTAILSGTTGESSYKWTGPASGIVGSTTTQTVTVDSAGTYTLVTVPLAGAACKDTLTYTIFRDVLEVSAKSTDEPCFGDADGTATSTTGGGIAPFTYAWTGGGGANPDASGLVAGTYTVTLTDHHGCSVTASTVITQPKLLTVTTTGTPVSCNGGDNGSATSTTTGGTVPYTYLWSPNGQTTANATGLTVGVYTVNVTDINGCTASATVNITQPPLLTATMNPPIDGTCTTFGSATVSVTGGTPAYTYLWNTTPIGQTTATATGLSAGVYVVTITDSKECATAATVTITEAPSFTTTTASTQATCNLSNGSATVTVVTGGTAPFTYSWAPAPAAGQTTATATGLPVGTYTATVTDNLGCTGTNVIVVPQPPVVTATMGTIVDPLCNGETGSATVNPASGVLPYTYLWNDPAAQTTVTANGLTAGSYTVTVTDNNGCTATATAVITQPALLTATMGNPINVLCSGGDNGSVTVAVTGGTIPYTYSWSPGNAAGQTTATATGLTVGAYTVIVTDNNNCTSTATVTITEPTPLGATTSFTPASCNLFNGTATVTVTGGTTPYTYLWSPGAAAGQTTATATGLNANPYTVVVTDNNGCSLTTNVTVTQPPTVTVTMTDSTGVSCFGGDNGTATATAVSGSLPYIYSWSSGTATGQTATEATGLTAGTYTITVTDNVGCISTATVVITQPLLLTLTIGTPTNVLCNGGDNGSAPATATGGTQPYTYLWAPTGETTATANTLTAGIYTATVTDNNGCTASATVTITQPPLLTAIIGIPVNVLCNGGNNGSATATPTTGGTGAYTYSWTTAPAQTTATATGLTAGTYTVIVTDNNDCTSTADVIITQPALLSTTITITNVSCFGFTNGSLTANPTGGTQPYTYKWAPVGGVNATANNLSAGVYTVTVTDNNGCLTTESATVNQPAVLTVTLTGPQTLCAGAPGSIIANVAGGTTPYTYNWSAPITSVTDIAVVTPTVTTTYSVTITDANGCQINGQWTISVALPLLATSTGATSYCLGTDSAYICASASLGTPPYTYNWEPGNYNLQCATVTPTVTTVYTVTVTDHCGETATSDVTVQINPLPDVSFYAYLYQGCIPFCVKLYNTSTISAGSIQSYAWKFGDGDTSSKASPQDCYPNPGVYTVSLTATSNFGCSATLTKPNLMTAYALPVAAFTFSPSPGTIIINPTIQFADQSTPASATAPIVQWTWPTFGDATDSTSIFENPEHTYQDTGHYCPEMIIEDIHGCKDSVTNCLDIIPFFTLYIPSAFTPNGDGIDDTFFPKGVYVKTFEMYIFDRWGEQLYHTYNINQGWDGTVNGGTTVSQEDTYVYKIIATDWQNNVHNYIGRVTLLR